MKKIIKVLSLSLIAGLLAFSSFVGLEPQLGLAASATDDVVVTLAVTSGISIDSPADVTMDPLTMSQLTSVGTTTWTVITNNQAGYTLGVKADYTSRTAALKSTVGEQFTDYGTSSPATWIVSSDYKFGFAPLGADVTGYGTGSLCESANDVPSTSLNYVGFDSADRTIATNSAETSTSGTPTTVCYAAEQDGVWAPSGTYTATITATATTI